MNLMRRPLLQQIALLLALCGMSLRALIPAGFMPATDAHRGALLMLCSGGVLKAVADRTQPGMPKHHAMQECLFAASAAPALPTLPVSPFPLFIVAAPAPRIALSAQIFRKPIWTPPATGPPAAS